MNMRLSGIVLVSVAWVLASSGSALADPAGMRGKFMPVSGFAQPPYGFVRFCERMPQECAPGRQAVERFDASPKRMAQLVAVNLAVNLEIRAVTDLDLYGESDYWTIPRDRGDCEDYVLLKRKRLIALGWPRSALLITVVRDERGEGHAVLTARTTKGDYILDNKTNVVKVWSEVPYHFVMRQSYLNPRVWKSLEAHHQKTPAMPLAGVRNGR